MDMEQNKQRYFEEAEEQYKLDLEADPKHVSTHTILWNSSNDLGRKKKLKNNINLHLH